MDSKYIVRFPDKSMKIVDNLFEYGMFTRGYKNDETWSFPLKFFAVYLVICLIILAFILLTR